MKYQNLFLEKNKKTVISLSSAEIAKRVVKGKRSWPCDNCLWRLCDRQDNYSFYSINSLLEFKINLRLFIKRI